MKFSAAEIQPETTPNLGDVQPFGFQIVNHEKFSQFYHMSLPFADL